MNKADKRDVWPCPPENMRPDRPEIMTAIGEGSRHQIGDGVSFESLVGGHNQARNLTTGIVTFEPGAKLPYHLHEFTESVTLLSGTVSAEVQGRRYAIGELDNVTIPRGFAHQTGNASQSEPAVIHIAMGSDRPERTLVDDKFPVREMPGDSLGSPGGERVTRTAQSETYSPGMATEFVDFFNEHLMPGIEMSGGYGVFQPGGRLPAHAHDFDESICIVEGAATCIVEGRHFSLDRCATALQPRGRVHYFINETQARMAMIWAYAGPLPERSVVDERCATLEGDPWK